MIIHWVILAVLFVNDAPVNMKSFALDPTTVQTAADCQRELDAMHKEAKARNADIWGACVEVKREPTKSNWKGAPGTEERS